MGGNRKKKTKDEVEQLLEAAQDEMMLKLSVDSHMSRVSPDYLHPDLHHRFLALKSRPSSFPPPPPPPDRHKPSRSTAVDSGGEEDLFVRFAALKASLPSSSSSASGSDLMGPRTSSDGQDQKRDGDGDGDGDREDEVEKVIRWAMDAARPDPSPPSDSDDDHDHDYASVSSDDDRDVGDDNPSQGRRG